MKNCQLCGSDSLKTILEFKRTPIFQNKVYSTEDEARKAVTGDIVLVQCMSCGFVFNKEFNEALMQYDVRYQNEQAHSDYFQSYVEEIIELLKSKDLLSGKIVEIGCGKGYFLNRLLQEGVDAIGFDPAYEGKNPRIIKDYFSDTYQEVDADAIILRHTLEHIQQPLIFLQSVAKSNGYRGKIFVEVPCFDWIRNKNAFWDIYYEHCNYFSMDTLRSMFTASIAGRYFRDQYLYLIADLSDLKTKVIPDRQSILLVDDFFLQEFDRYKQFLRKNKDIMVWGAGAKGVTFVNLLDPERVFIQGLIDINPKKKGRYIAKTAHKIYGSDVLRFKNVKTVLIMNENYLEEIMKMVGEPGIEFHTLGVI